MPARSTRPIPRLRSLAVLAAILTSTPLAAADLSPQGWPAGERRVLQHLEQSPWPATARTVEGRSGYVAASLSPIAAHAGIETLRQGGTAADAALTTALTQVTTSLGSIVSYAGVLQLLYYDAATHRISSLDAGWNSYADEKSPATIPHADSTLLDPAHPATAGAVGRETLVPGFMAGVAEVHARFGRLSFSELFKPAIWYSTHGIEVTPLLAYYFAARQKALSRTVEGRRFLAQAGGPVPHAGDRFVQPEVAKLLRDVAAHGSRVMYTGAWADSYVRAVRAAGGLVTAQDLSRYRPIWEYPQSVHFGDLDVAGPGSGNASGCAVLATLNLLDAARVNAIGPYWTDPRAFTTYAQALQVGTSGPYAPQVLSFEHQHGLASSCAGRTAPGYAAEVAPALPQLSGYSTQGPPGHHSAAVVAIDQWGNVAALVHSCNCELWGDTGIVVGGIPIPNAGGLYQYKLAAIPSGGRLSGDMAPVIATRNHTPVLAVATIGTSLIQETVRLVASFSQADLTLQKIMAAPPLLLNIEAYGDPLTPRAVPVPEKSYGDSFLADVKKSGIPITQLAAERVLVLKGTAAAGLIDSATGRRQGVEIPRVVVFTEAY
ncbi:MAG TPA: gamma-glutamyltransferase [Steroidobacteraceae bacterium]|nr:gamma-glutamyltransferase [Steroidobacteraceae bacterium]